MFEIIKAGGWVMLPLLLCSVITLAIIAERFWSLQHKRVTPDNLVTQVWTWSKTGVLDAKRLSALRKTSPLGYILAAGLGEAARERSVMKERIEDVGRHVVHDLGRYLNTLGTIAAITPLLGLLGTVVGMIKIFAAVKAGGMGNATALAGGIAEALITTAAGLTVAIPALLFYRYFRGRVDELVIRMEQEALKLVDAIHGLEHPPGH